MMASSYAQNTAKSCEIHGTVNLPFKRPVHEGFIRLGPQSGCITHSLGGGVIPPQLVDAPPPLVQLLPHLPHSVLHRCFINKSEPQQEILLWGGVTHPKQTQKDRYRLVLSHVRQLGHFPPNPHIGGEGEVGLPLQPPSFSVMETGTIRSPPCRQASSSGSPHHQAAPSGSLLISTPFSSARAATGSAAHALATSAAAAVVASAASLTNRRGSCRIVAWEGQKK